jgi:hypothetical protein
MLEIIAMITMLIDHIGYIFFPDEKIFRYIGRVAFPIYVYSLTLGYHYTKSHKMYVIRLLRLAFVSQIPYTLAFVSTQLNVIFTLLICLLILWIIDNKKWFIAFPLTIILIGLSQFCDYGFYGVLLALIYRYSNRFFIAILHLLLNFGVVFLLHWAISQLYSIIGSILIVFSNKLKRITVHRTFYRVFYPLHLFVLFLVEVVVYGDAYFHYLKKTFWFLQ